MALLFVESFDHFLTADVLKKWKVTGQSGSGASATINAAAGRHGSSGFRFVTGTAASGNTAGYLGRSVAPGDATACIGFAFQLSAVRAGSIGHQLASIRDAGTAQLTLRLNANATLSVVPGIAKWYGVGDDQHSVAVAGEWISFS